MNKLNLEKIINWLIIIFLLVLPWQTRYFILAGNLKNNYWEYGTLAIYASDILIVLIIILSLINYFKSKKSLTIKNSWLIISGLSLMIINLFFSLNKTLSLWHWGWLLLAFSLFFIIKNSTLSKTKAYLSLIISASLSGLLGLWQFISQSSFASNVLGLAKHDPANLGVSVIEAIAPDGVVERWLRAYGSLDHPNMLGGLMMIGLMFSLIWLINRPKDKKNIFIYIAIIFLISGLVLSFSRAAWLAFLVGALILFIYNKNKFKNYLSFILISLITICLLIIPYYYLFTPRFNNTNRLEKISTTERYSGYREVLPIIKNHPLLGVGLGNYGLALEKNDNQQTVWFYQPVHNIFLLIFSELGLVGLILFIYLLYLIIKKSSPEQKPLIISTIASICVLGMFDHWLISLHFGLFLIAISLGLALNKNPLTYLP